MNRVQITFKSGAQIEFDCDEVTTSRNSITGHLIKMDWSTPEGWTEKLHLIELDQIVAIVAVKRPDPLA